MYGKILAGASCLVALTLVAALPAAGYETYLANGYGEGYLGDPIDQVGTRRTPASPPVELRINLLWVLADANGDGIGDAVGRLTALEETRLTRLVQQAIGYWNSVPSSWGRLRLVGTDETSTYWMRRPYVLITVASGMSGSGDYSRGFAGAQILPRGIRLNAAFFRGRSDLPVLSTLVHELGHALGLHHSTCDRELTRIPRFANTDSLGAYMSYGDQDGRPALHSDDIAGISYLYEVRSLAGRSGSIEGELLDATGQPIFGGNVFAVDATNRAIQARLSGLSDFRDLSATNGRFRLTGLTPGTYTLVAAPIDHPTYRIGMKAGLQFESSFRRAFEAVVIPAIEVRPGLTTRLGRIVSGARAQEPPQSGLVLSWPRFRDAQRYIVSLWRPADSRKNLSCRAVNANSVKVELEDGAYMLHVSAPSRLGQYYPVEYRRVVVSGRKIDQSESRSIRWNPVPGASLYCVTAWDPARRITALSRKTDSADSGPIVLFEGRFEVTVIAYFGADAFERLAASKGRSSAGEIRRIRRTIVRTGKALTTPAVVTAPGSVTGRVGGALSLEFTAVDPFGGPIQVEIDGLPKDMRQIALDAKTTRLEWAIPSAGRHELVVRATNEIGLVTVHRISIEIEGEATYPVSIEWARSPSDAIYHLDIYDYATKRWVRHALSSPSYAGQLAPGRYLVVVLRGVLTPRTFRNRTCRYVAWYRVAISYLEVKGPIQVRLP